MKQLAKAILSVMKEVKGMEKNSRVGKGGNAYNGTKDQDVKEVFNEALSKNGLCIMPIDIQETTQIDRWEAEYNGQKSQKQSVFTKATVKYLLLHESGESQELVGYGHGVDPQDKGAGKATTYALKNLLLYTFLTPVGKMDDTDKDHSDDIPVPQPKIKPVEGKPRLADDGYTYLMTNGTVDQINEALAGRQMTLVQGTELEGRREELKTKSK
jgi:hypothetical protein